MYYISMSGILLSNADRDMELNLLTLGGTGGGFKGNVSLKKDR